MLIGEFCRATGLTRDTVRFYVRKDLLRPAIGSRTSNRYLVFDQAQVERAALIRSARRLGFTLKEIAGLAADYEAKTARADDKAALLRTRIADLDAQARRLRGMRRFFAAKLRWVENGEIGPSPTVAAER